MKRALVLSGGGFRGAIQVPIIDILLNKYSYDAVYGVSVGSLNGALAVQGDTKVLWDLWNNIDGIKDFLSLRPWVFNGIYSMAPLRKKLELFASLHKVQIPMKVGIVSLTDGAYYTLETQTMQFNIDYWNALEASSCIAGLMKYPTIYINNKPHIGSDGGFRNIVPLVTSKYDSIDAVLCTPLDRIIVKDFTEKSLISLFGRSLDIMQGEIFSGDVGELVHALNPGGRLTLYAPKTSVGSLLEASAATIQERYKVGYQTFAEPLVVYAKD